MNNLVNTIEIYSDLMTSNNHEKENLKEYLIENIKDKSFRNEFVNEINDFISSPYFSFLESSYKSTINELIKNNNCLFIAESFLSKTSLAKILFYFSSSGFLLLKYVLHLFK